MRDLDSKTMSRSLLFQLINLPRNFLAHLDSLVVIIIRKIRTLNSVQKVCPVCLQVLPSGFVLTSGHRKGLDLQSESRAIFVLGVGCG
jgi:hypothetical protein